MKIEEHSRPPSRMDDSTSSSYAIAQLLNEARNINSPLAAELTAACPGLSRFMAVGDRLLAEVVEGDGLRNVDADDVLVRLGGERAVLHRIAAVFSESLHCARQDILDIAKKLERVTSSRDDTFRRFRELSMAMSQFSNAQYDPTKTTNIDPATVRIYFPGNGLLSKQGEYVNGMIRVKPSEQDYGVFGPYVTVHPGFYEVSFLFDVGCPCKGMIDIDVVFNRGEQYSACYDIDLEATVDQEGKLGFLLNLDKIANDCEFRILSSDAYYTIRACMVRQVSTSELPRMLDSSVIDSSVFRNTSVVIKLQAGRQKHVSKFISRQAVKIKKVWGLG